MTANFNCQSACNIAYYLLLKGKGLYKPLKLSS